MRYPTRYPKRDSYGYEIKIGDLVAYNRSGQVKCGRVRLVTNSAITIVERDTAKESRVISPLGIFILEREGMSE